MTDDDKALVKRLRGDWPEIMVEKHWMMDSDAIDMQRTEAADRIEAQAAEIEKLREALKDAHDALVSARAIEQHEAFRQEVSDAVEDASNATGLNGASRAMIANRFARFIIAKPDPLVEALDEVRQNRPHYVVDDMASDRRAAIEKRGGKIVWGEG